MSGGETSCPKSQGPKRPGPKRLSPKSSSAKSLSEHSLYDCEISSMIVTFPEASLWVWGFFNYYHLNLIYDSLIGLT